MPPRYVYWTIIVDGQPTAFRSGSLEDIMPTFNRVKEKQPAAELKWFQNGQLWPSRQDAQDFIRARGERGRQRDPRQSTGGAGGEKPERAWNAKPEWKTRSTFKPRGDKPAWAPASAKASARPAAYKSDERPEWKPKGASSPKPQASSRAGSDKPGRTSSPKPQAPSRSWSDERPEWKPKGTFKPKEAGHASGWGEKPGWKPKGGGSARDQARASFRPKSYSPKPDDGMTRSSRVQSRDAKLEWKPKGASRPDGPNAGFAKSDPDAPKRKWVPKAEYKKSLGIEAKRDDKWRPGGEHKDPKQKYKDAKKAKWTKFKATIRARSTRPRKPKDE